MRCIVCGCTEDNACVSQFSPYEEPTRCEWVHAEGDEPLCSFCADQTDVGDELVTPSRELILPGDPEFHL